MEKKGLCSVVLGCFIVVVWAFSVFFVAALAIRAYTNADFVQYDIQNDEAEVTRVYSKHIGKFNDELFRMFFSYWKSSIAHTNNASALQFLQQSEIAAKVESLHLNSSHLPKSKATLSHDCYDKLSRLNDSTSCFLPCPAWSWKPDCHKIGDKAIVYVSIVILLGTFIALIAAGIAVEIRPDFPKVVIVYFIFLLFVTTIVDFVRLGLGESKSYCHSSDKLESWRNPTAFILAQGIINSYIYLAFVFWFAFVSVIFLRTVQHPELIFEFTKNSRRLHTIGSVIGWLFPALFLTGIVAWSGEDAFLLNPACAECLLLSPKPALFLFGLPYGICFVVGATSSAVALITLNLSETYNAGDGNFRHKLFYHFRRFSLLWAVLLLSVTVLLSFLMLEMGVTSILYKDIVVEINDYVFCTVIYPRRNCSLNHLNTLYPFTVIGRLDRLFLALILLAFAFFTESRRKRENIDSSNRYNGERSLKLSTSTLERDSGL